MAARAKEQLINLLPQEEFAASTLGRVMTWTLSTFRVIVIGVEMIVVLAFLSRFWLDARVTDLNDELKQKQALIKSFSDFEKDFRLAQHKLAKFSEYSQNEKPITNLLLITASVLPNDITFSNISIDKGRVLINANSYSESSISQFMNGLKKFNLFKNISLNKIEANKDNSSINFGVEALLVNNSEGGK